MHSQCSPLIRRLGPPSPDPHPGPPHPQGHDRSEGLVLGAPIDLERVGGGVVPALGDAVAAKEPLASALVVEAVLVRAWGTTGQAVKEERQHAYGSESDGKNWQSTYWCSERCR